MQRINSCPLLKAARAGDETAFERLVEPHRKELPARCYRVLASLQDTEEAMQEAMLRVWRGLERFEGRRSLRSWLYRIATNTRLDITGRRKRRLLPEDYGPNADPSNRARNRSPSRSESSPTPTRCSRSRTATPPGCQL
jgi:RNA polymerase sigma factor (sigma-70 family)